MDPRQYHGSMLEMSLFSERRTASINARRHFEFTNSTTGSSKLPVVRQALALATTGLDHSSACPDPCSTKLERMISLHFPIGRGPGG